MARSAHARRRRRERLRREVDSPRVSPLDGPRRDARSRSFEARARELSASCRAAERRPRGPVDRPDGREPVGDPGVLRHASLRGLPRPQVDDVSSDDVPLRRGKRRAAAQVQGPRVEPRRRVRLIEPGDRPGLRDHRRGSARRDAVRRRRRASRDHGDHVRHRGRHLEESSTRLPRRRHGRSIRGATGSRWPKARAS